MEKNKKNIDTLIKQYAIIFNESELNKWINNVKRVSICAFSIETNRFDNINDTNLTGISFAIEPGIAAYIPLLHNRVNKNYLPYKKILSLLKPLLEDENLLKVGTNLKYNRNILQNHGIELRGIAFDTLIESYIIRDFPYKMSCIYNTYSKKNVTFSNQINRINCKKLSKLHQENLKESGNVLAQKADTILQLHIKTWKKLQRYAGLLNVFKNIDMPLVPVLSRIECNGVKINPTLLQNYSVEITVRLTELKNKAYEIVGKSFNLESTKEIQNILFKKHNTQSIRRTPRGKVSTSEKVLELLSVDNLLPKIILEYRRLSKLKKNYADKLPMLINQKTGRLHTTYHQTITVTGRLSSSHPNLQNIPIRKEEGKRIRQAFIAPKDYFIVSVDYSQIELRIMAHFSHDKNLLKVFSEGKDIHRTTASEIFHIPLSNVTDEQRYRAKIINFSLIYGISAFGLSHQLNISYKESQKYINFYFERYPGVLDYMNSIRRKAKEKGYVETLDGRRLFFPNIKSENYRHRASAERAVINAPLQGTAADIIKRAMIVIDKWIETEFLLQVRMIMQVHDELVFEVHKDNIEIFLKKIRELMENIVKLDIPLKVTIKSGKNWDFTC